MDHLSDGSLEGWPGSRGWPREGSEDLFWGSALARGSKTGAEPGVGTQIEDHLGMSRRPEDTRVRVST